jgi:hypothetical protein
VEKQNPTPGFPRDRDGEIFQADLTDELEPSPKERAGLGDDGGTMEGEDTDSQAGDDFMHDREFPQKK